MQFAIMNTLTPEEAKVLCELKRLAGAKRVVTGRGVGQTAASRISWPRFTELTLHIHRAFSPGSSKS